MVEYLLSQEFVDKTIYELDGENIYHVVCEVRGAEELLSIIERKVPHHLLLNISKSNLYTFDIACYFNNIIIVKSLRDIGKFTS